MQTQNWIPFPMTPQHRTEYILLPTDRKYFLIRARETDPTAIGDTQNKSLKEWEYHICKRVNSSICVIGAHFDFDFFACFKQPEVQYLENLNLPRYD